MLEEKRFMKPKKPKRSCNTHKKRSWKMWAEIQVGSIRSGTPDAIIAVVHHKYDLCPDSLLHNTNRKALGIKIKRVTVTEGWE